MIHAFLNVVYAVFDIFQFLLIANVIFSWLYAFNIINSNSPIVRAIGSTLYKITDPVLRPIRRILPNFGTIDISPIIALLIIYFIQSFISNAMQGRWL